MDTTNEFRRGRTPSSAEKLPAGIQSVENAVEILETLAAHGGPISLTRLCEEAGLQPSKLHRYLVSLVRTGLVVKMRGSGHYDLGPAARRIGARAYLRFDGANFAHERGAQLAQETGHSILVYSWNENSLTLIRSERGRFPLAFSFPIGSRVPLSRSAAGLCVLAFLPPSISEPIVASERADVIADGLQPRGSEEVARDVVAVRKNLCHVTDDGLVPGIRVVAAPAFDANMEVKFVLALLAHRRFVPDEAQDTLAAAVLNSAAALSFDLGLSERQLRKLRRASS